MSLNGLAVVKTCKTIIDPVYAETSKHGRAIPVFVQPMWSENTFHIPCYLSKKSFVAVKWRWTQLSLRRLRFVELNMVKGCSVQWHGSRHGKAFNATGLQSITSETASATLSLNAVHVCKFVQPYGMGTGATGC